MQGGSLQVIPEGPTAEDCPLTVPLAAGQEAIIEGVSGWYIIVSTADGI